MVNIYLLQFISNSIFFVKITMIKDLIASQHWQEKQSTTTLEDYCDTSNCKYISYLLDNYLL